MRGNAVRQGGRCRIARAPDGENLVLDDSSRDLFASITGAAANPDGPPLASPFAGYGFLAWLRERSGDGPAIWMLRCVGGERLNVLIADTDAVVECVAGRGDQGNVEPVHDIRNHLNIVQTTIELMGLSAKKAGNAILAEPLARVLRQVPPMTAALEKISAREREHSTHALLDFLRRTIERTAWSGQLLIESDSAVKASAAFCDAVTRCVFEWASHELARHGRGQIGIADSSDGMGLVFSGPGIGDWVRSGMRADQRFREWLRRWSDLDVSAGAWATKGGGAMIGVPR
jgi:hypothetical protein